MFLQGECTEPDTDVVQRGQVYNSSWQQNLGTLWFLCSNGLAGMKDARLREVMESGEGQTLSNEVGIPAEKF